MTETQAKPQTFAETLELATNNGFWIKEINTDAYDVPNWFVGQFTSPARRFDLKTAANRAIGFVGYGEYAEFKLMSVYGEPGTLKIWLDDQDEPGASKNPHFSCDIDFG